MQLAGLLMKTLEESHHDVWENERTPTPVRRVGVRLHTAGLSIREMVAILELLGVHPSHDVVWQWKHRLADSEPDPPTAWPSRVAVDETAVQIGPEWYWLYAAVDLDSLYLLDIGVFSRHGTDSAATFLHKPTEKYDVSAAEFLVDSYGYRTVLARLGLSGQVEYSDRNHVEKWFHTFKMRTDRFHTSWVGSRPAVAEWCQRFKRYYNQHRPNQALDGRTPAEVLN
ncbi:IS6 family transposase [Halorubellus sp. JP-L1]|uniref:IS6 family transposase n=1 Tax=Halorubellus sp. JP-L1 TaxID=2715753 RepID=UPI00140C046E|nr:IS6 family transposase [Halorubellus sp. JP-L1]NHN42935.1 IS6 family transposase [Halorubellus sp. JP-L1]